MHGVPWRQAVGIPLNVLLFCLLQVMAWEDARGFFAHPARAASIALLVLSIPVMTLCTAGRSRGTESRPDHRAFYPLLVFHSLFTAVAMPRMDRHDVWTIPGGDVVRYAGLAFFVAGVALRLWPMLALGRRFASVVALQEGHRLETRGLYGVVRHPSYLGIFLMDVGYAGIYRSALGLLLLPMVFWMFRRRIELEERFLVEQFGDEYRAYMARVPRLLPGIW